MITFILSLIFIAIVTAAAAWLNDCDGAEIVGAIIAYTIIFGAFSFFIICMVSSGYIEANESELTWSSEKISEVEIRTLQDNTNNIAGRFALGFGSVKSASKFYFYVCESDSSYYLESISTDGVKIIESDTEVPCVVKYKKYIDWPKNDIGKWLFEMNREHYYFYIYVPKNTIMINYNLDAQ